MSAQGRLRPELSLHLAPVQTKKVERKAVSSSDSEEEKEDKITVAYKSTRSAVSRLFKKPSSASDGKRND